MENESKGNNLAWTLVVILSVLLAICSIVIFSFYTTKPPEAQKLPIAQIFVPSPSPVSRYLPINKTFFFPIYDSASAKVGEIIFTIKDVQRSKNIEIAGQKATAVGDRELVILNIELTNSQNIAALVNTRNYVRLKVNGQDKLLAPDFHGDPVDLQPQSTQEVRLAFSIAEIDTDLILQVGELTGPKDLIQLN
jgi:hypothetical protein